jgi:hypothetical protein
MAIYLPVVAVLLSGGGTTKIATSVLIAIVIVCLELLRHCGMVIS